MSSDVSREHNEIKVALGKIETKLEHVSEQITILHTHIKDRENEIEKVEALARINADRLTAIEAVGRSNRWWIALAGVAATVVSTLLSVFIKTN